MKKVFVSGCYDLLHSGHVEFFRQASQFSESPIYNKVENGLMGENNMAIGFFVPLVCFIVVAAFAETLSENKGALARKDSFSNQSGSVNW